jgi:hypothetical protein
MDASNNGDRPRFACIALDYEDTRHLYRTLNLPAPPVGEVMFGPVADRFLDILGRHDVKATLFVVGEDMLDPRNRRNLRRFVEAGHEVANHTMTHPFGMRRLAYAEKVREIADAQKLLEDVTGQPVVGYKAPAHDIDADVIDILESRGFLYDASVYPSFFNPLLNVCYRIVGGGRPLGLGDWQCSLAPNRPYRLGRPYWQTGTRPMVEFPISQIPGVKFPVYATVMFAAGIRAFRAQFAAVRRMRFLTYVFHSFDLFGENDDGFAPALKRYPALRRPLAERLHMVDHVVKTIASRFESVTYRQAVTQPEILGAIL